jgi:D-xylose transport system permease protein
MTQSKPLAARFLKATELDTRMLGMVGALALIWIGFHLLSGGLFLTPRNLWNLSVQSSSVAIMATGMMLVIVSRNIDLSIGSMLGFIGMIMGITQTDLLPRLLGFENPATWAVSLGVGLSLGVILGGLQGFVVAYLGVPSFIVTLGGLLVWRGAAWWVTSGQTIAPLDSRFRLMGGGPEGSIGADWSWLIGALACLAVILLMANNRIRRTKFLFPLRPMTAQSQSPMLIHGRPAASVASLKQTAYRFRRAACSSGTVSPSQCLSRLVSAL